MKITIVLLLLLASVSCFAAVPVTLAPLPQFYATDSSGRPLSFGCVSTFQSGTTTPLTTYTDSSGVTPNPNPVILSAAGNANIWIQAGVNYTFRVKSAGGTNCAAGTIRYTVNGIGGGTTQISSNVTTSATPTFTVIAQNQLFLFTISSNTVALPLVVQNVQAPSFVIFQLTQDTTGGWSFTWPANVIGGCTVGSAPNQVTTQMFVWNGTNATAVGPCVIGAGPAIDTGSISATGNVAATGAVSGATGSFPSSVTSGQFVSTSATPATTGVIKLATGDQVCWRNNANSNNACIAKDALDELVYGGGLSLGGGVVLTTTNQSGTAGAIVMSLSPIITTPACAGVYCISAPEVSTPTNPSAGNQKEYAKANHGWCALDSAGLEYCTQLSGVSVQASSITLQGSPVTIPASTTSTVITKSVTMPAAGCPCRAFVSYGINFDTVDSGEATAAVFDGTNRFATGSENTTGSTSDFAIQASSYSTGTYANSASVTFILQSRNTMAGGVTVHTANATGLGQSGWLNVAIFTSQ